MSIDKQLSEMRPKDTPLLVLGYIILGMFLLIPLSANADDNEVYLGNISGDNLELDILQAGTDNTVTGISTSSQFAGDDNTLHIMQTGTSNLFEGNWTSGGLNTLKVFQGGGGNDNFVRLSGFGTNNTGLVFQGMHHDGSIDTDETGDHEAYWTVTGDYNEFSSFQTDTNRDSGNGDSHHLANIIDGDYNDVWHRQRGKAGHDGFIEVTGNHNDVILDQKGSGGKKWADIVLDGDGHNVDINQRGTNYASATVDLTFGTGAYTFDLNQNVSTSAVTYTLTGICNNGGGCSVTVNQNN